MGVSFKNEKNYSHTLTNTIDTHFFFDRSRLKGFGKGEKNYGRFKLVFVKSPEYNRATQFPPKQVPIIGDGGLPSKDFTCFIDCFGDSDKCQHERKFGFLTCSN